MGSTEDFFVHLLRLNSASLHPGILVMLEDTIGTKGTLTAYNGSYANVDTEQPQRGYVRRHD